MSKVISFLAVAKGELAALPQNQYYKVAHGGGTM